MTGENNLNAADRLKDFIDGIQNYMACKNLLPTPFNAEFAVAETLSLEQLLGSINTQFKTSIKYQITKELCFNTGVQMNPNRFGIGFTFNTKLISIMHANNEIGVIQPINKIGEICKKNNIFFHVDAAQSLGKINIDVSKNNVDLLSLSSHGWGEY